MTWVKLALAIVQIAQAIMRYANERKLIRQGEDRAVATAAQELLAQTSVAREIEEEYRTKTRDEIIESLKGDFRD